MAADGSRLRADHLPLGTPSGSCGRSMKARRTARWSAWILGPLLAAASLLLGDSTFAAPAQGHTSQSTYGYDAPIPTYGGVGGALHNVQVDAGAAARGSYSAASEGAHETVTTATGHLCVASRSCVAAKTADDVLPGLPEAAPKPLGLGSTGRVEPANLTEQLAMTSVRADPAGAMVPRVIMSDARWPAADGWVKMQQIENGVNIHYVRNTVTGAVDDFKFK